MWAGDFFATTTLSKLGLRIQLGHPVGETCVNPVPAKGDNFVVIDLSGIHNVKLDFCGCERAEIARTQLLRFRWFPATVKEPHTAATFRVLKYFQVLTFESKASGFQFYHALHRLTDNTGLDPPKVCSYLSNIYTLTQSLRSDNCRTVIVQCCEWFGNGAI